MRGKEREDHAISCICGGDIVTRHNAVLDVVFSAARNRASNEPPRGELRDSQNDDQRTSSL